MQQTKKTPASVTELAAAMAALGMYNGDNTEAEHKQEAERLGISMESYRMRLANALLGIAETEAMHSETDGESPGQLLDAHWQALQSAGATRTNEVLLRFLVWRTLRIEGPLRQLVQDETIGPIPLSAAHAAVALQKLLHIAAEGQSPDSRKLSPEGIKNSLNSARDSLTDAIANLDIMIGMMKMAEEQFRPT